MPREDRRIFFDHEETYKAIYALCMQKEMRKPPPGYITNVSIDKDNEQRIRIRIENPQDSSAADLEYGRDFMAAALMLLCRSLGIPIPRKSQKSVEVVDGGTILLRLTM